MRDNVFWAIVGTIGLIFGVCHFAVWPEASNFGRAWDGLMGAAILGNLIMLVANVGEYICTKHETSTKL